MPAWKTKPNFEVVKIRKCFYILILTTVIVVFSYFEGCFQDASQWKVSFLRHTKLELKQLSFNITKISSNNKDYDNKAVVQTLSFKGEPRHNFTSQKGRNYNFRPIMKFQKLFTLSTQGQIEQNGIFKSQKAQISSSLKLNTRKIMISKPGAVKRSQPRNIKNSKPGNVNNMNQGKVKSCPGFDSYSTLKVLSESDKRKFKDWQQFEQNRVIKDVNCRLLFDYNTNEQNKTMKLKRQSFQEVLPHLYINKTKNCAQYIKNMGFITSSLTEEEENFPIAYSILVFKGIEQVETLLRSIYRPQNVYCIHCDTKADKDFKLALHSIVGCFTNVFLSTESFNVRWGTFTVFLPELTCMRDLWKHKKWKYFINLTGQEFPLRTNYELVKILQIYNGANDIEGTIKRAQKSRWSHLPNPPHNIIPVKGSVHIVASRGYVQYLLYKKIAEEFFNWTKGVHIPDEVYFTTLNHNPHLGVPGSYKGVPETNCETKPFLARFKNWGDHIYNWPCHGKRVRQICIFGIGDLPLLSSRQELFANKFHIDYQPYTYHCMDELIFNRTRDEYFNVLKFDTKKYQSLEFIKHTIL